LPVQVFRDWDEPDLDPEGWEEPEPELPRRDPVVDDAKEAFKNFFARENKAVFYQRQLQVIFEADFFHWITAHALAELAEEGSIASDRLPLPATGSIILYRAKRHRYWKRQAGEIIELVSRFSEPAFTRAVGEQGEIMFDAALPVAGFLPTARKVRSYGGKEWTETKHDLDRVFERDGISYGSEIKNALSYIDREELYVKLRMCKHLGLRPLFIVRMAPKNYIHDVEQEGGFTLVFKYQLYPFGEKTFADKVQQRLQLPTDSPARISDGTVKRFLNWHLGGLRRGDER